MVSLLAVIYIVFISLGLPDSMFGVAWPVVHQEFQINENLASLYSIISGIGSGAVSFMSGFLIRKLGTPKITLYSTLLTAIGLLGISFAPNLIVMMLCSIVLSFGAGAIDTALNNYAALHFEARHMNWLHCFWGLGVTISPIIMAFFLNDGSSWRNGYRVVALMQLVIALGVAFYLKTWKKFDLSHQKKLSQNNKEKEKVNIFKFKGIFTSILSQGFCCAIEFLIGTWGASYLINTNSFEPDTAARWVSLYYGGIMLGRLVAGFVSMKVNDNNLIRGGIFAAFLGVLVLFLPIGAVSSIGLLLIGFGSGPIFPSILHCIPNRFGEKYSADITGVHMAGAYGLGFACQLVFGYIATATTFKITPFVLLGFCALLYITNEIAIKKTK